MANAPQPLIAPSNKDADLRGTFMEAAFTVTEVELANVEEIRLGLNGKACAFLGTPPQLDGDSA